MPGTGRFGTRATALCLTSIIASMLGCTGLPTGTDSPFVFNLLPTPVITADVVRGVAPLRVQFDSDRSTDDGVIVSRVWDFGDGTATSEELAPLHTFATTGEFTVRLTLTDDLGAVASSTVVIVVTEAPVAVLSIDRTVAEFAPAVFNLDASASFDPDGEIASYRWDFGDGSVELLSTVQHQYASSGVFRVVLTVTDDDGVAGRAETIVSVGIPTPVVTVRTPPSTLDDIMLSSEAPLWVQAEVALESGVPFTTQAGIDADQDPCDSQAIIYDRNSGVERITLTSAGVGMDVDGITDAAYSPDGATTLVSGEDGSVLRHDAASGSVLNTYEAGVAVNAIAFAPDGLTFAAAQADATVVVRNIADGAIVRTLTGHSAGVLDVAFSSDGTQIVSGGSDRRAIVWSAADGSILRDFEHPLAVNAVACSPADPTVVATGCSDSIIRLWNITGGTLSSTLTGHGESVNALAFSIDGLVLVSGSDDDTARAWSPGLAMQVATYSGHDDNVVAVAISLENGQVATGSADGSLRTFTSVTGALQREITPCISPISAVAYAPNGTELLAAVAARNATQLDTNSIDGVLVNDLPINVPTALDISGVAPGEYFAWMQVDTDRTDPVRVYANPLITIVDSFPTSLATAPPVIPADAVAVVTDETNDRQIVDLGRLERGDRLFVSFLPTPGFVESYTSTNDFAVTIVDRNLDLFAWYTQRSDDSFVGVNPIEAFFTRDSRLIIGHTSESYYLILDGGLSASVRIERGAAVGESPVATTFLVDFRGASDVSAGIHPPVDIPEFVGNLFDGSWGDTETAVLKSAIMNRLTTTYSGFNVNFVSSDDVTFDLNGNPIDLPPPFQTIFVGGVSSETVVDGQGFDTLLGIADFVDPRNETASGSGIVFASTIDTRADAGAFLNDPTSEGELGDAMGRVAAHVAGLLLGLRPTDEDGDVMEGGDLFIADPTVSRTLSASGPLADSEQILDPTRFPPIGQQNAPVLLSELVGP